MTTSASAASLWQSAAGVVGRAVNVSIPIGSCFSWRIVSRTFSRQAVMSDAVEDRKTRRTLGVVLTARLPLGFPIAARYCPPHRNIPAPCANSTAACDDRGALQAL